MWRPCTACVCAHANVYFVLPDGISDEAVWERERQGTWDAEFCEGDGRFFLRCTLDVPYALRAKVLRCYVWVAVAERDYDDFLRGGSGAAYERPRPASLANRLPPYAEAANEPVVIRFRRMVAHPAVSMKRGSRSRLTRAVRYGITPAGAHDIVVEHRKASGISGGISFRGA